MTHAPKTTILKRIHYWLVEYQMPLWLWWLVTASIIGAVLLTVYVAGRLAA